MPVIKVLDDAFGIESGTITTIHSSMHDQQVIELIIQILDEVAQQVSLLFL